MGVNKTVTPTKNTTTNNNAPDRAALIDNLLSRGRDLGDLEAWIQLRKEFFHDPVDYNYLSRKLTYRQLRF